MKKLIVFSASLLTVLFLVALGACQAASTYKANTAAPTRQTLGLGTPAPEITLSIPSPASGPGSAPQTYAPTSAKTSGSSSSGSSASGQSSDIGAVRMIVRTGNLTLIVDDISASIDNISQLAESLGGYVVSSNRFGSGKIVSGTISIRIPESSFDNAMRSLRALSIEVTADSTSSQDVSEEYSDLTAKLKNLEATEAQLIEIMKKAEKVEDVLAVQRQLTSTRDEIERTKGRMQYLQQTSETSLITVQLEQAKLEIQLVAGTRIARADDTIGFYVDISGGVPPFSYNWDFGDKNTSVDESPWHTYTSSGKYSVSVTVTDDRGNKATDTREDYINVLPGWSAGDVAKGAWRGFVGFGRFFFALVIWLGIFSPVWLIGGGIGILVVRRRRKKRAALQKTTGVN